jgi:hypothetical protein
MKQLKSTFKDLHRIFRQSITAREVAEHLVSFETDHPAERVKEFMRKRGFDVVGTREEGVITGYVEFSDLAKGVVGDFQKGFNSSKVLNESDPMLDTLEALKDSRWVFIKFLGNPSGIVTRGDLQKAPMRMWLFGLISLLEMNLKRRIREQYPKHEWLGYLSSGRREKACQLFDERKKGKEEIDLVECLYLTDMATVFVKSDRLRKLIQVENGKQWERFARELTDLRNKLAHANPIGSKEWPDIAEMARKTEEYLAILES